MMTEFIGEVTDLGISRSKLNARKSNKKVNGSLKREVVKNRAMRNTYTPKITSRS